MTTPPTAAYISEQPPLDVSDRGGWRRTVVLIAMCMAAFMIQLDVTIVNVALPTLQRDLTLGPAGLEWVISGYALSLATALLPAGALGDMFGHRSGITGGLVLFGLGSLGCAIAPDSLTLITARIVQGVGDAAMLALTLAILNQTFPASQRSHVIGLWAALGGIGFGTGPVVGGLLLGHFGWPSVFWVNLPITLITMFLVLIAVPPGRHDGGKRKMDLLGVALASIGLATLTLGLIDSTTYQWLSPQTFVPLLIGATSIAAFLHWQGRAANPLIPPALRRAPTFLGACGAYFASYTAFSGTLYYVTLLFQNLERWSALETGLSWLLMNLPFLVVARLAGNLDRRFSSRQVIAGGCLTAALGVSALAWLDPDTPFILAAFGYLVAGAGFGALVPAITHSAMREVPQQASGAGAAVLNCARQLGTATGLALIGALGSTVTAACWNATEKGTAFAADVASGQITAVQRSLGAGAEKAAASAFLTGYHAALAGGALCLLFAGALILRAGDPLGGEEG